MQLPSQLTVGTVVCELEILQVMPTTSTHKNDQGYRVRYLCCGKERVLTYRRIRMRVVSNAQFCAKCSAALVAWKRGSIKKEARKKEPEPDQELVHDQLIGIPQPTWKRPRSVAPGYWLWGQR